MKYSWCIRENLPIPCIIPPINGKEWTQQKKIAIAESDRTPGLVVSSIVLRPDLAAGWDFVFAKNSSVSQEELNTLFRDKVIPNSIKNKHVNLVITRTPQFLGVGGPGNSIRLGIPVKGAVKAAAATVYISGAVELTVNLENIKSAISEKGKGSYLISADVAKGKLFGSIDTSKISITRDKIASGDLDKLLLDAANSLLVSFKEMFRLKFNTAVPLSLNKPVVERVVFVNSRQPELSFIAMVVGLTGKKGSKNLSPDIIARGTDIALIASNKFIMTAIEVLLNYALRKNKVFLTNDFLEFKPDVYPLYLETNQDSEESYQKCDIKIKIDKGELHSTFLKDLDSTFLKSHGGFGLNLTLGIRYRTLLQISWHTYWVQVFVTFGAANDELRLNFKDELSKCINFQQDGIVCPQIKTEVEKQLARFEALFTKGLAVTIPDFAVKNVLAPSYIRLSGKIKV